MSGFYIQNYTIQPYESIGQAKGLRMAKHSFRFFQILCSELLGPIKLIMKTKVRQNPQELKTIASHALYNNHKLARQQIQNQRQQAQHTLSFLEREAKKTARELERKQKSLINYYRVKQSRFLEAQQKQALRRKREAELDKMRKTNSLHREISQTKRSEAKESLVNSNKRSASSIKTSRILSEQRKDHEKQLERQLLRKRNSAFSKALEAGRNHSKQKAFSSKRSQSSSVNSDLIYVQQNIKNRQIHKLSTLNARQKELVSIVEKNRKQKQYYQDTFQQFQTVPFEKIYPSIRQEERLRRSRRGSSRRSSLRSESLLI